MKTTAIAAICVLTVFSTELFANEINNDLREKPSTSSGEEAGISKFEIAADAGLSEILNEKLDVAYRRDFLSEVLEDLNRRAGLRSAFPRSIASSSMFTVEEKQITVKNILEKIAAKGHLDLEYSGDTAIFWQKADDPLLADLKQQLAVGDTQGRCKAVRELANLADKRVFPLLFQALEDKESAVVTQAVSSLRENHINTMCYGEGIHAVVESLLKIHAAKANKAFDDDTISLMGATRDESAFETLKSLLTNKSSELRVNAIGALGRLHDPRAVDPLISLLKNPDSATKVSVANAFGLLRDARTLEPLAELLKIERGTSGFNEMRAIGKLRDPRAIESLISFSKDADPFFRSNATFALQYFNDSRIFERLSELCKDTDAGVRFNAALALGELRDPRCIDPLAALLQDADVDVQAEAYIAMGQTRDPRAVDISLGILKDGKPKERVLACTALGQARDPRGDDALLALSTDKDPTVRAAAVAALRCSRHP